MNVGKLIAAGLKAVRKQKPDLQKKIELKDILGYRTDEHGVVYQATELEAEAAAVVIQKNWRMWMQREKYLDIKYERDHPGQERPINKKRKKGREKAAKRMNKERNEIRKQQETERREKEENIRRRAQSTMDMGAESIAEAEKMEHERLEQEKKAIEETKMASSTRNLLEVDRRDEELQELLEQERKTAKRLDEMDRQAAVEKQLAKLPTAIIRQGSKSALSLTEAASDISLTAETPEQQAAKAKKKEMNRLLREKLNKELDETRTRIAQLQRKQDSKKRKEANKEKKRRSSIEREMSKLSSRGSFSEMSSSDLNATRKTGGSIELQSRVRGNEPSVEDRTSEKSENTEPNQETSPVKLERVAEEPKKASPDASKDSIELASLLAKQDKSNSSSKGDKAKKSTEPPAEHHQAATKIQSVWRGHSTRLVYRENLRQWKQENHAATTIQRHWRGYAVRRDPAIQEALTRARVALAEDPEAVHAREEAAREEREAKRQQKEKEKERKGGRRRVVIREDANETSGASLSTDKPIIVATTTSGLSNKRDSGAQHANDDDSHKEPAASSKEQPTKQQKRKSKKQAAESRPSTSDDPSDIGTAKEPKQQPEAPKPVTTKQSELQDSQQVPSTQEKPSKASADSGAAKATTAAQKQQEEQRGAEEEQEEKKKKEKDKAAKDKSTNDQQKDEREDKSHGTAKEPVASSERYDDDDDGDDDQGRFPVEDVAGEEIDEREDERKKSKKKKKKKEKKATQDTEKQKETPSEPAQGQPVADLEDGKIFLPSSKDSLREWERAASLVQGWWRSKQEHKQQTTKFNEDMLEAIDGEELEDIKAAFEVFDTGLGTINISQMGPFLRTLGQFPSDKELLHMAQEIDENNDGVFQFEEFVTWFRKRKTLVHSKDLVQELFSAFDRDGNGFIAVEELMSTMNRLGATLTEEEAAEMIQALDVDYDGQVSFSEFKTVAGAGF